jgi:hypothetical protein
LHGKGWRQIGLSLTHNASKDSCSARGCRNHDSAWLAAANLAFVN